MIFEQTLDRDVNELEQTASTNGLPVYIELLTKKGWGSSEVIGGVTFALFLQDLKYKGQESWYPLLQKSYLLEGEDLNQKPLGFSQIRIRVEKFPEHVTKCKSFFC